MNKGMYIVVEGPQGVGKTTAVQKIAARLQSAGTPVRIMREPDSQNDLTARAIRHLTQDPRYPMNTRTEVLLYNAARSQSLDVIRQARQNGIVCLVDRSYLTTLAIQYYGRGDIKDYQRMNDIITFAVGDMQPDLMVVLDAPVSVLKERTKQRYSGDRFDNLDVSFLERIRAGYLWEAKQRGFAVVSAVEDVAVVFEKIWQYVDNAIRQQTANAQTTPFVPSVPSAASTSAPVSVGQVIAERAASATATQNLDARRQAPTVVTQIDKPTLTTPALPPDTSQPTTTDDDPQTWLHMTKHGKIAITEQGYAKLTPFVTSTTSPVYAFTSAIDPLTVSAAMARLSRRGDDMRITLLDEFIGREDKDGQLLKRVITAYGDDSVQQLMGLHIVVENASNILTKRLEWGRLAAYLEQSTRYIYFDQKDANGNYRYYIPQELTGKVRAAYTQTLNAIFGIYTDLVKRLTEYVRTTSDTPLTERDLAWKGATKAQACDAIRPLLPVATTSTVGIYASGQALESLITHLMSDELPEARKTGQRILDEARKVVPALLERADKPERGGAAIAYRANTRTAVKQLADTLLSTAHAGSTDAVVLTSYTPHNELDVVADILYEHSSLPLRDIKQAVASLSYDDKARVFQAYIGERLNRRHKPGRALETIHYSWDLMCDYGIFRDLQRHRMVDDLEWQTLTPRYGYDIPRLVEEAGFTNLYEKCFDLSVQLYSALQAAGYEREAQYATLLGHKMRWKVTMNARESFHFNELRTSPQGHPGYRKLVGQMYEKICEVHPLIGNAMKFVNKDEDPALTRLAAERYTQFKLAQINQTNRDFTTSNNQKLSIPPTSNTTLSPSVRAKRRPRRSS
jgi:dTMP kinase